MSSVHAKLFEWQRITAEASAVRNALATAMAESASDSEVASLNERLDQLEQRASVLLREVCALRSDI